MATGRKPEKSTPEGVDLDDPGNELLAREAWAKILDFALIDLEAAIAVLEHGQRRDDIQKPIDVIRAVVEKIK